MTLRSTHLNVGRITGPHGIRGAVRLWDYAGDTDVFQQGQGFTAVTPAGVERSLKLVDLGPLSKGLRAVFAEIRTREDAEAMKNTELWVSRDALPALDEGEVYQEDLPGYMLHDLASGEDIGEVLAVEENPGHDHLIVRHQQAEVMVPLVPEIVESYDTEKRLVLARLPEGLLEIYLEAARDADKPKRSGKPYKTRRQRKQDEQASSPSPRESTKK